MVLQFMRHAVNNGFYQPGAAVEEDSKEDNTTGENKELEDLFADTEVSDFSDDEFEEEIAVQGDIIGTPEPITPQNILVTTTSWQEGLSPISDS